MNSIILMAEIIQDPQLRYTPDNQIPIAEMLVQFPSQREEDPPSTLKVIGWGNLAQEINEKYHQGDQIVIEGRLGMNTIDRSEGFKEKRAELTAQRIYRLEMNMKPQSRPNGGTAATNATPNNVVPLGSRNRPNSSPPIAEEPTEPRRPPATPAPSRPAAPPSEPENPDYDPIPF